jgi:Type IX secretion system protein PorV
MKKVALAILIFLTFMSGNTRVYSQDVLNPIQTVVPFLTIAPDSRAGGMGDAGVATSPDVYSMHWNPAKFAFIDGKGGVGISYTPWLRNLVPDINIAYLSGYWRIDNKQVISGSLIYSSLGDVPFTDDFGNLERVFKPNEFAMDAAYSRLFGGSYSGGAATKAGTSFAADVSGLYRKDIELFSRKGLWGLGFNFSNIGTKMTYSDAKKDFIPMNLRVGTSGSIYIDPHNKLTLTLDLNKLLVPTPPVYDTSGNIIHGMDPNVSVPVAIIHSFYDAPGGFKEEMHEIQYATGIEYWYNEQFAVRGGYFHENETKGNRKYFTVGAGFKVNIFALDFSYLIPTAQNNPLARTLRFSLSFNFNNPKAEPKTKG